MSKNLINANEAMQILQISRSSLYNLTKAGKLQVEYKEGRTKKEPFYLESQVQDLAGNKTPLIQPTVELPQENAIAVQPQHIVAKYEPERHAVSMVPIWKKLTLTIEEASIYTGLGRKALLKLANDPVRKLGTKEFDGRWRFIRSALDAFFA